MLPIIFKYSADLCHLSLAGFNSFAPESTGANSTMTSRIIVGLVSSSGCASTTRVVPGIQLRAPDAGAHDFRTLLYCDWHLGRFATIPYAVKWSSLATDPYVLDLPFFVSP